MTFSRNESALSGPIAVRFNGSARRVYLQARPITDPKGARSALVLFLEGASLGDDATDAAQIEERATKAIKIWELPRETIRAIRVAKLSHLTD